MRRTPVASAVLNSVLYLADQCLLEIEFRSREVYQYFGVPLRIYNELLAAESKGEYFNANFRDCFPCQHLPSTSQTAGSGA